MPDLSDAECDRMDLLVKANVASLRKQAEMMMDGEVDRDATALTIATASMGLLIAASSPPGHAAFLSSGILLCMKGVREATDFFMRRKLRGEVL